MKDLKDHAPELTQTAIKASGGFGASFFALSANDIAGLIVAFLTAVYLILQIMELLHKRRQRRDDSQKTH